MKIHKKLLFIFQYNLTDFTQMGIEGISVRGV